MNAKIALALEFTKALAVAPRHGADSRESWAADVCADAAALTAAFAECWGQPAAAVLGDPYAAVWAPPLAMTPVADPEPSAAPTERPPSPEAPASRPAVVVSPEGAGTLFEDMPADLAKAFDDYVGSLTQGTANLVAAVRELCVK